MKPLSVRARINLVSLLPVFLVGVLVIVLAATTLRIWIMRSFQAEHASIAVLQAQVIAEQASKSDLSKAGNTAAGYLNFRPEMRAVTVTDLGGQPVWHSTRHNDESARIMAATMFPVDQPVYTEIEGNRLYVAARIATDGGIGLGLLQASISTEPVYQAIYANLAGLLGIIAAVTMVGFMLAIRLKSYLTNAIDDLVDATRKIDKGARSIYIARRDDDELGELAAAIERMAGQLHNREDEIRQAQSAAEAAPHAKIRFLTTMSREIRTSLTTIIGYADLLHDGGGDAASQTEAAASVLRNARHLLSLVNDALDLAKIEAGMMTAQSVPADPDKIIYEAADTVRPSAEAKGLRLELELADQLSDPITTDPTRLRQIILKLLSNAVKFTHSGTITLQGEMIASQPPMLRISVQDTGIGMTADQVSRLFKPFTQGDAAIARCSGGNGLGLALAQQMARLLGGSILVDSTPGKGARFMLQVLAYPAVTHDELPAYKPKGANGLLAGARVVVVEDAPDTQRVLRLLLEREGALVKTASNGQEAVDFLGNYDLPCVVLMDIEMPVLDGFAATQQLREMGFASPIIAVTAHITREDRERCLKAGCNDFLPKPIRRDELIQLLAGWVAHVVATHDVEKDESAMATMA